ncbi:MAG: glycosyltransferase, partial [Balneolales bacterium]|nr:glycosyltransferase [Balneolales bacterium]
MKKLLIIGTVWPEPTSSAAGSRMMELVRLFSEADFAITFSSIAARSDYSVSLGELGVKEVPIRLNDSSFDDFVRDLQPDVVIFDRYFSEEQFGWRVAEVCPGAVRVLDTEDLHFLRSARKRMLKQIADPDVLVEPQDDLSMILSEPVALREVAAMYRCDLSLIISSAEMLLLERIFRFPAELLFHLPFLETTRVENLPDFAQRRNFVSIGNFLHDPNTDAVRQLKSTIWPLIRSRL